MIQRAAQFKITDLTALDDIARILVRGGENIHPDFDLDEAYESREAFQEGRFTDLPDFSNYDNLLNGDDDEDG